MRRRESWEVDRGALVALLLAAAAIFPGTALASTPGFSLPDSRGWELVSPVDKNGGEIQAPGGVLGGGVFQAAAAAPLLTYSSTASFGAAQGAPGASQYLSSRTSSGWVTENLTIPLLSGGYGDDPDGVPYQLFSPDLGLGLVSNGERCRGPAGECPVLNPPVPGSGAPPGYRNYYLRDSSDDSFEAILQAGDLATLALPPEQFELDLAGASPDLEHVVLSSCAALTADAVEVPAPGGCDPAATNLYLDTPAGLELVNVRPGDTQGTPGARLASQSAIGFDGTPIYWSEGGELFVTVDGDSRLVGSGAEFQAASPDGGTAFFTAAGHLFRYDAEAGTSVDLTPGGGVLGMVGASIDGTRVYYVTGTGLVLDDGGTIVPVAPAIDPDSYPPATGTARVSADGSAIAFVSASRLTEFENDGVDEAYVYDAQADTLTCASCNPTGELPLGPARLPGARSNGTGPAAIHLYKPRSLSADGSRLFFDSDDSLAPQDTNLAPDTYQWEAQGKGSCATAGGCVSLLSSGRSEEGATFVDAAADGDDVFFVTDGSLVPADPGGADVYDARVGGGWPTPPPPIPCTGDACQPLPPEPEDPGPATLLSRPEGNPPVTFPKQRKHHKKHKKRKHGKKKHQHGKSHRGRDAR